MTDNLNSIILEIRNGQKKVEGLKSFLQLSTEIIVDANTFKLASQCLKATKEAVKTTFCFILYNALVSNH